MPQFVFLLGYYKASTSNEKYSLPTCSVMNKCTLIKRKNKIRKLHFNASYKYFFAENYI